MRIGLDLDGPIYPWHDSIYRYFREFRGFEGDERCFWDYFRTLEKETQDYYVSIPILYLNSVPSTDVLTYVPKLAELGSIYYITARGDGLKWATWKFFDMYQLPFKENLIFSKDKASYVRLNKIDIFLDDLAHNVEALQGITDAYLFKASHNHVDRERFRVVNSIRELYEMLEKRNDQ